jgi:hypothetical protein
MKLSSKRVSLTVLVLAVVCLITRYVLCYWCGYYQKSFTPIGYQELLALLGLALFPVLLITWIFSLLQRKHRLWTTAMLAGLLALMPWPHDLILYGMRDGMLRNYKLDDIRHFARDFDQLPDIPINDVDEHTKFYWNWKVNDDLAKTGLKEKYPFLTWCEFITETDDVVYVYWGGFENHWGFAVDVNGKRIDPQILAPSAKIIRVSDDVFFQSDY